MNSSADSTDGWTLVDVTVDPAAVETVSDSLWTLGVAAVEEVEGTAGETVLRTSLGADPRELLGIIGSTVGVLDARLVKVPRSVADTWREHAVPTPIDARIAIVPAWAADMWPHADSVLVEPGDVFGVGNHPTTVLAARLLLDLCSPGESLYDLGCGTGVLAILAARHRGARTTVHDIAPGCESIVEANRVLNGVGRDELRWGPIDGEDAASHDVVAANILAPVLRQCAGEIMRIVSPKGRIVLSGMRTEQSESVLGCYEGWRATRREELDGWVALALEYR